MANVKIALRVRPLSEHEKNKDKSPTVVDVEDDGTVAITNLKIPLSNAGDSRARVKRFSFDFCFDSTSSSKENFADQDKVYENLGKLVLESLSNGRDACILAYGQSSSGKTYTIQGNNSDPGLAPRLCRALMDGSKNKIIEASVSFFEIYNERVKDLLVDDNEEGDFKNTANRRKKDLRVREHPKRGPYVEELSKINVHSAEELHAIWLSGVKRRRTAATATNCRSSRSHALLSIRLTDPYPPVTLTLLDLAGSERPCRVNQSLPRQKEGANINKSLVALANVISALVAAGSRGGRYVPYRDSVLTWLLKDTLSGRATTIMIATVSPSADCYSETVNTMRWASRAARIPQASGRHVCETSHERALRELRVEVNRLRALLAAATLKNASRVNLEIMENTNSADEEEHENSAENSNEKSVLDDNEKENKVNDGSDSIDSLASSRISVASADTGHNSAPLILLNSVQAEDVFFGPRLHRAGSDHAVKPLRPKRRQYGSHEVLPFLEKYNAIKSFKSNSISKNNKMKMDSSKTNSNVTLAEEPSRAPEVKTDTNKNDNFHANQSNNNNTGNNVKRAEIVASVTDRLSKIRRKDDGRVMKVTNLLDRKISQPTAEGPLTNTARKKLFDLSHRALWASRRFRIGIPVETQTERPSSTRVKHAATDVPDDLEPFEVPLSHEVKLCRNAAVSTEMKTLLYREISVGTPCGSVYNKDKNIETDKTDDIAPLVITRSCGIMTEIVGSNSITTQTEEVIPPKRKYSSFTKYLKLTHDPQLTANIGDRSTPSVLNISISHDCDSNETDGISDDSLEIEKESLSNIQQAIAAPPDLLHNHNSNENIAENATISPIKVAPCIQIQNSIPSKDLKQETAGFLPKRKLSLPGELHSNELKGNNRNNEQRVRYSVNSKRNSHSKSTQVSDDDAVANYVDFLDDMYVPLPRIYFNPEYASDRWPTMKNLILGRNENIYPYNIQVSPCRERLIRKRNSKTVSWKSEDEDSLLTVRPAIHRSIIKKSYSKPVVIPIYNSESETCDSDDVLSEPKELLPRRYFKGIYCWGDESPVVPRRRVYTHRGVQKVLRKIENKKCADYVDATSNFLNKATDLVSTLSEVSSNLQKQTPNDVCNAQLHFKDEAENNQRKVSCSHTIKDSLVDDEESLTLNIPSDGEEFSSLESTKLEQRRFDVDDAENNLLASLNRLETCTKKTSEYFATIGDRYMQKFNRKLPKPMKIFNNNSGEQKTYQLSQLKSPRKYLHQLLELRKELVETTKRDDDVNKHFQVR